MKLRDYQIKMKDDIKKDMKTHKEIVMAMCPNSGKTITSIKLLEELINENKIKKALVLTHGTTVLRKQYFEELKKTKLKSQEIRHKNNKIKENVEILVGLPQTLCHSELKNIDLIVIDEAHEFYKAEMVQKIIKKCNPKHIILLTGTPSYFIYENKKENRKNNLFKINIIAMSDIPSKHFANLSVFICSSSYNIKEKDFTQSNSIKEDVVLSKKDTNKSLDMFLEQAIKFCKMNKVIPLLDNVYPLAFSNLKKTLIVCATRNHANLVYRRLKSKKVKCLISISNSDGKIKGIKRDDDSENIQIFKKDKEYKVLVVVGRARLGFNCPELENVIDMSATRNPDLIYQIFSRVSRFCPNVSKKRYFKIAPIGELEYTEYVTAASLTLIHKNYMSIYDGKNFSHEIPILVDKNLNLKKAKTIQETGVYEQKLKQFQGIDIIVEFTKTFSNLSKSFNIYSKTNLSEVRKRLNKQVNHSMGYWSEKRLTEIILNFKGTREDFSKEHHGGITVLYQNFPKLKDKLWKEKGWESKEYTEGELEEFVLSFKGKASDLARQHSKIYRVLFRNFPKLKDKLWKEKGWRKDKKTIEELIKLVEAFEGTLKDFYTEYGSEYRILTKEYRKERERLWQKKGWRNHNIYDFKKIERICKRFKGTQREFINKFPKYHKALIRGKKLKDKLWKEKGWEKLKSKRCIEIKCIENQTIYKSTSSAAKDLKLNVGGLLYCITKSKVKTYGGYSFEVL